MSSLLLSSIFSTEAMQSVFDDAARIRAMIAFEAALAAAEAEVGVVPADAAKAIAEACGSFAPDMAALAAAARRQATPAIPIVKALTAHCPEPGRGWVHWGATSQDVMDTGLVLQMREAMALLDGDLVALGDALAALALEHRHTVMAGRTLLQPALPITFGFKCAGWLDAVAACRQGLGQAAKQALVLQFGGAVGTLAALGAHADAVREALAKRLNLPSPDIAWHTNRVRLMRLCSELTIMCGALAKIAGDIALMMQGEIGEAGEPAAPGRGGSSTMPHKRNPVAAVAVRANALRAGGLLSGLLPAMVHEHERGAGGWQAEWETIPQLFELAAGTLAHLRETSEGLEVNAERMRSNLDADGGAIMAEALMMTLAPHIGRGTAHELVEALVRRAALEGKPLREVAGKDAQVAGHLENTALERALDPSSYLGLAAATVDAVTARWNDERRKEGER